MGNTIKQKLYQLSEQDLEYVISDSINLFQLSHKYKLSENKADDLTAEIKKLWFENNYDEKKIESYRYSLRDDITVKAVVDEAVLILTPTKNF